MIRVLLIALALIQSSSAHAKLIGEYVTGPYGPQFVFIDDGLPDAEPGVINTAALAGDRRSLLDAPMPKLLRCYRRCEKEHGPLPSPVPTHSPTPTPAATVAMDCSDGSIGTTASRRTLEPGRIYHLCLTVPADAKAPAGILQIDSVNHANASCNVYQLTLTRPDGAQTAYHPVVAPVARPNFARGKWGVTLRLDPDNARCANNPGLSLWAYWF